MLKGISLERMDRIHIVLRSPAFSFLHNSLGKHRVKAKFVLVGIWNTVFGYGVFCFLDTLFSQILTGRHFAYMSAMVLGQIIAVINAYVFHKLITFRSDAKGRAIIREFCRFSSAYAVTFCLSVVLLFAFVEIAQIPPKLSAAMIILICTIISYLSHSRFSFKSISLK